MNLLIVWIDGQRFMKSFINIDDKLHIEMFKEILLMNPDIREKYYFYPYYYFPRGSVLINEEKKTSILSLPMELSSSQKQDLLSELKISNYNIEYIEGEHYSIKFIEYQIDKSDWSVSLIKEEKDFSNNFYMIQINKIKPLI